MNGGGGGFDGGFGPGDMNPSDMIWRRSLLSLHLVVGFIEVIVIDSFFSLFSFL